MKPLQDPISFKDLVLHTLFDQFEFGAHSFVDITGPYYINSIGAMMGVDFPAESVLKDTKDNGAKTIYLAHTHPLSDDQSLNFIGAEIDPREEIAFGFRELPVGNSPSISDVAYLKKVKAVYKKANVTVVGLVFSTTGIWKYDPLPSYNKKPFETAYYDLYPARKPLEGGDQTIDEIDVFDNWATAANFPNYYMELLKPKARVNTYRTQISKPANTKLADPHDIDRRIAEDISLFNSHGVALEYYAYEEFDIEPVMLMRNTLKQWSDKFVTNT